MLTRPDQSFYLAHFTKNGKEYDAGRALSSESPVPLSKMSAREKLVSILKEKKIRANKVAWTDQSVVCFTECPWSSLLRHAKAYSPYGIGFTKKLVYSRNGNPVFYVSPSLYEKENWNASVYPFVTPFVPAYAADNVKNRKPFYGKPVDYSHEREWRVAKDFPFQYTYVRFVILDKYEDLDYIPEEIRNEIGLDKFIFMDTYRKIEELWPTHIME